MSDCERRRNVAQLVEQRIRNAKVEGSIPFTGTNQHVSKKVARLDFSP